MILQGETKQKLGHNQRLYFQKTNEKRITSNKQILFFFRISEKFQWKHFNISCSASLMFIEHEMFCRWFQTCTSTLYVLVMDLRIFRVKKIRLLTTAGTAPRIWIWSVSKVRCQNTFWSIPARQTLWPNSVHWPWKSDFYTASR
jgi:hypothetical protein